ncbi:long-chain-alcohol O-fatty-acyltransferase-like [Salvia splendens]|uniref:long-chain-alcohol O-fatty-acyltransferase-like n=1 Tax=Salvia splendens TaxID=180675 RepID=UPI001C26EC6D|nr:long-chain-alcohol O-fatty-acyltransferase-like [Salvia splendens]
MEIDMKEEINNLIMVLFTIGISSSYCYGITKLVRKGIIRFLLFLPVLYLLYILPLYLKALIFNIPIAFFVTWLTPFKLLQLVFDTGPLSNPSLSLLHFVTIFCFPIKPHQKPTGPTKPNQPNDLTHYAIKVLLFLLLTKVEYSKHMIPQMLNSFLICIYSYLALEITLGAFAVIARSLIGIDTDHPFDHPYLSTSLQDFWGRRWNRVASSCLKSTIFFPFLNGMSRILGRKWAAISASVVTFIASDVMHEIVFYYMDRVRFGWGLPTFFIFQGICVVIESTTKKKIKTTLRLPQRVIGPLIFVCVVTTFMLLVVPELLEHRVDDRVLGEYVALAQFLRIRA